MVCCGQPLELCDAIPVVSPVSGSALHPTHSHVLLVIINRRRTFDLQHPRPSQSPWFCCGFLHLPLLVASTVWLFGSHNLTPCIHSTSTYGTETQIFMYYQYTFQGSSIQYYLYTFSLYPIVVISSDPWLEHSVLVYTTNCGFFSSRQFYIMPPKLQIDSGFKMAS